jgi:bla regulator protein blaR1
MYPLFVNEIFSEQFVKSMCWTLVHSLWQGLLLAMVTGLIILFTRRSEARIRYGLFSLVATVFLVAACFTFAWQWSKNAVPVNTGVSVIPENHAAIDPSVGQNVNDNMATPGYQAILNRLVNYFNEHASAVVMIWFVLFSMRLVKIFVNLGATQRIRHHRVHTPSAYWIGRLQELAKLLHIKVRVTLVESELIHVPMMAGIFKPVILLPFSLLSQLPPEQVEAVLLHELAHIRRWDYMFNLVQSFAEILFFFNPGVLWISSLIREERENCCDDIAVQLTGRKKEFIHALVSFQENNKSVGRFAIGFRGAGNHLLQRVKRLLYRDNKVLDGREKFFLLCSCLVTAGLILAFSSVPRANSAAKTHKQAPAVATRNEAPKSLADTVLPPAVKPAPVDPDKSTAVETPIPAVSRDTLIIPKANAPMPAIDAPPVPPAPALKRFRKDTTGIGTKGFDEAEDREWKAKLDEWEMKQLEWQAKQIEWQKTQEPPGLVIVTAGGQTLKENKDYVVDYNLGTVQIINQAIVKSGVPVKVSFGNNASFGRKWNKQLEELQQQLAKNNAALAEGNFKEQEMALEEQRRVLSEAERDLNAQMKSIAMAERKLEQQKGMLNIQEMPPVPNAEMRLKQIPPVPPAKSNLIGPVINDLIADKLIDHLEVFSFVLNKEGLIVNDVRQPDEVFQRYKEKYIKDPRTQLIYSRRKDGSESSTINVYK